MNQTIRFPGPVTVRPTLYRWIHYDRVKGHLWEQAHSYGPDAPRLFLAWTGVHVDKEFDCTIFSESTRNLDLVRDSGRIPAYFWNDPERPSPSLAVRVETPGTLRTVLVRAPDGLNEMREVVVVERLTALSVVR